MTKEMHAEKPLGAKLNSLCPGKRSAAENYVLVIHGGAGSLNRENSTPEKRTEYRAGLARSLKAGYEVLKLGGEAMDVAAAAVTVMEDEMNSKGRSLVSHPSTDFPLRVFTSNAGKGSVFNVAENVLSLSVDLPATLTR